MHGKQGRSVSPGRATLAVLPVLAALLRLTETVRLLGRGEERSTLNAQRETFNHREWEILTNELKRYEYAVGPTGQISYSAPAGFHDDCVMALALANHRRWETENCGHFLRLECGWRGRTAPLRVGGLRRERCLDGY